MSSSSNVGRTGQHGVVGSCAYLNGWYGSARVLGSAPMDQDDCTRTVACEWRPYRAVRGVSPAERPPVAVRRAGTAVRCPHPRGVRDVIPVR